MILNPFSLFLNSEEAFLEFNSNLLETNLINILILIGILVYATKVSFSKTLEARQQEIIQTIENAQKDVTIASNYAELAFLGFNQSVFWLQLWKNSIEQEKLDIVSTKYKAIKNGLEENFLTTEYLIQNFEKKSFLALKRYILLITASKILRKFLNCSEKEQSKLIELTILKLGASKK